MTDTRAIINVDGTIDSRIKIYEIEECIQEHLITRDCADLVTDGAYPVYRVRNDRAIQSYKVTEARDRKYLTTVITPPNALCRVMEKNHIISEKVITMRHQGLGTFGSWMRPPQTTYSCIYKNNNTIYTVGQVALPDKFDKEHGIHSTTEHSGWIRTGLVNKFKNPSSFNNEVEQLLGCNCDQFCQYIEERMEPEMTLKNLGSVWTIGYILTEEQAGSFHERVKLTNFYPMFKKDPKKRSSTPVCPEKILEKSLRLQERRRAQARIEARMAAHLAAKPGISRQQLISHTAKPNSGNKCQQRTDRLTTIDNFCEDEIVLGVVVDNLFDSKFDNLFDDLLGDIFDGSIIDHPSKRRRLLN